MGSTLRASARSVKGSAPAPSGPPRSARRGEIAPRFTDRPGGYTRMVKVGPRLGDGAEMVVLELVEKGGPVAETKDNKGAKGKDAKAKDAKAKDAKAKK